MSLLMDALKQAESAKRDKQEDNPAPPESPRVQPSGTEAPATLGLALVDAPALAEVEPRISPEPAPEPFRPEPTAPLHVDGQPARDDAQAAARILAVSASRLAAQRRRNVFGLIILGLLVAVAIGAYYYYAALAYTQPYLGLPQSPLAPDEMSAGPTVDPATALTAAPDADQTMTESGAATATIETISANPAVPALTPWREGPPPEEPVTRPWDAASIASPVPHRGAAPADAQTAIATETQAGIRITRSQRPNRLDIALQSAYEDYRAGRLLAAESGYRAVLAREPGNRDAQLGLAALAVHAGQLDDARQAYRELLRRNPKDQAALAALASLSQAGGAQSETELKLRLVEQPQSAALHFALANLYAEQRRWPLAQQAYFEAQRLVPEHPDYSFNLAVSLEHIDRPKLALAYYRRALDLAAMRSAQFDAAVAQQRIVALAQAVDR